MRRPEAQADGATQVLTVSGLTKRFGEVRALDQLDFEVRRGECFGLLGPNGAGKSTTFRMVLGLSTPDSGDIRLLGHLIPAQARVARRRVGVVPQADLLDPDFTVSENLVVFGRYFSIDEKVIRSRIDELLDFAGLQGKRDARINELSGGMKRRLTIARALINEPEVLFLDEPTTGLDPQARHLIWERLRRLLARGTTIVLTTHFMEEAERLCNRLAIVDHGRVIATGSPAQLIERYIEPSVIEISGENVAQWVRDTGAGLADRVELIGESAFLYCRSAGEAVAASAAASGLRVLRRPANIEDVFMKLTGRDLRD